MLRFVVLQKKNHRQGDVLQHPLYMMTSEIGFLHGSSQAYRWHISLARDPGYTVPSATSRFAHNCDVSATFEQTERQRNKPVRTVKNH